MPLHIVVLVQCQSSKLLSGCLCNRRPENINTRHLVACQASKLTAEKSRSYPACRICMPGHR
jgi:hypothetical protein